jgi:hypothetical protein
MRQSTNRDMTLSVELEKGQTDASPPAPDRTFRDTVCSSYHHRNISRVYKNRFNFQPRLHCCAIDYLSGEDKVLVPQLTVSGCSRICVGRFIYLFVAPQAADPWNYFVADQELRIALHSRTLHDTIATAPMRTPNNPEGSRKRV